MIYSKKWAYGSRSVLMTLLLSLVVLVGYAQYTPGQTVTVSTTNNNTATGFTTTHVLTDNSGNIIQQVSGNSPVSFSAPNQSGTYRVYAVNYDNTGTAPNLSPGTNIGAIGGTCSAISSSPVTFTVTSGCVTPGTAINFTVGGNNTASGYATQYVLTDGSGYIINNNVTSPVTAPNQSGTFKVYAVNYNTGGTAPTLTPGTNINAIGGACTAVSSNPLEFCVTAPCVSPNSQISFSVAGNTTTSGYTTRYVKTDGNGQILDNNVSSPLNVGTTAGNFKIYVVNYSGTAPAMAPGSNISSVTGSCVDVSDQPLEYSVCTPSTVSGTIFHDPDGGNVNHSGTGANSVPAGLYVNLVDNAGNVVATAPVNTDGSYSLPNVAAGQYTLQLSTTQGTVGSPAPATSLPSGWANTGEYNGAPNSGNDGTPNGISAPFTVSAGNSVPNVNFGIEQKPTAVADVSNNNPAGPVTVAVVSNDTDPDGTVDPSTVSLIPPANATGITTDPTGDVTGFTVPGEGTWSVNPTTGAVTFTPQSGFTGNPTGVSYTVKDNAGVKSDPSTPIVITYTPPSTVSGTIFHDPDGGNVNHSGTGTNSVPAGLYVNLVDNAGNVVATAPVNTDGSYSLPNVAAGQYTLQLSTTQGTVGSPAPATSLPSGWVNTGEYNGAPNGGNDGTPNGISAPFTVSAGNSVANVNFGIEQTPTADGKTYTLASAPVAGSTINLSAGGNASNGSTPGNLPKMAY